MAVKLPPVNERVYRPDQLPDSWARKWYALGAKAGASVYSHGQAADWERAKKKLGARALSSGRAVEAREYFLGGHMDGRRGKSSRGNPGAWLKASAVRVIRDGRGRAVRLDIRKPARRRRK